MTFADLIDKLRRHPLPASCGFVLLLSFFVFYFRMDVIAGLESRHEEVSRQAAQMDANVVAGGNLDEHVARMRGMLATLEERLVRSSELAVNLKYFYQVEAETGVTLADLRQVAAAAKAPEKGSYQSVGYSVVLTGGFPQIVAYFDELESGPRVYRISNFNLQKSRELSQSSLTLALNLELLGAR